VQRIIWLGPRNGARDVRPRLGEAGVALVTHETAEGVIAALAHSASTVMLVDADWDGAAAALAAVRERQPGIEAIAVTRAELPGGLASVLDAGASRVVRVADPAERATVATVTRALARSEARQEEAELLAQIGKLTDELFKDIVGLERRNIELEERLRENEGAADGALGPTRILLADDENTVRLALKTALEDVGHEVETAEDGQSALDMIRGGDFEVVLVDKNMPRMSGIEVLSSAKQLKPEVAVIMITGYASQESAIMALNAGADAYMLKPFRNLTDVIDKVDEVRRVRRRTARAHDYLRTIKARKGDLLERYREVRAELERRFLERTGRQ
jgi:DNA-binding NtrC family response regulator